MNVPRKSSKKSKSKEGTKTKKSNSINLIINIPGSDSSTATDDSICAKKKKKVKQCEESITSQESDQSKESVGKRKETDS